MDGDGGGGSVLCIYVPKDKIVYINVLEKDRITNALLPERGGGEEERRKKECTTKKDQL